MSKIWLDYNITSNSAYFYSIMYYPTVANKIYENL